MKRVFLVFMALVLTLALCSCSDRGNDTQQTNKDGETSVFYYTYSDTYISGVRTQMDKIFEEQGIPFNDYDANGNQTTQTEQIHTALAKGASALLVNVVDTGSNDAAQTIINLAKEKNIPVIFFNRSVEESVITAYDKCAYVGTDYEMAGYMQGELIGNYLVENFDTIDLNGDGEISYVMFKGQEGNLEAISRTKFAVLEADRILSENNLPPLKFYDSSNKNAYLVDQDGLWSSAAATNYMSTILAQYSEANNNLVELVIANNDEMALGAISSLQSAGYNKQGGKIIPVFGVDATDAARDAIEKGNMTGTVKQDAEGMARAIVNILSNLKEGKYAFEGIDKENTVGSWRVNIPYSPYIGQ